jgi:hypothetical protein
LDPESRQGRRARRARHGRGERGAAAASARRLACGLLLCVAVAPARAALPDAISIVIGLGRTISPEQAQAPASFVDEDGRLLIVDQERGFVLGRFQVPVGFGSDTPIGGGVPLEGETALGPALPMSPLTSLRPLAGFPAFADGSIAGSPCLIDLDLDGRTEIITATTTGTVMVVGADGRPRAGWPRRTDEAFYAPSSAGDIDGDGLPEIVIGAMSGRLYAWQGDGSPVPGWPQVLFASGEVETGIAGGAALADVDRDGRDEIAVATLTGRVWLMGGNGITRRGWPKALPAGTEPPNPASVLAAPALADLDGDGVPDVIVATNAGRVHAWDASGASLAGWPAEVPHRARAGFGGAAVGDVNGDGQLEVVVAGEQGFLGPAGVSAISARGALLPGWPFNLPETVNAGPALGDLSGDGVADIVIATIGGDPMICALDGRQARPLPGWPIHLKASTVNAAPLIADLNGDGRLDVLVAALATGVESHAGIWAFDHTGQQLTGFPIVLSHDEIVRASPAVADIEGDGDLDLIAATEALDCILGWELGALCDPSLMPWATEAASPSRTGHPQTGVPAGAVSGLGAAPATAPGDTRFTTITFDLWQSAPVQLRIFDIRNRPVRRLLNHLLPPGKYAIYWDGRSDAGQVSPSGVYFYQLTLGESATTRQLLLLK